MLYISYYKIFKFLVGENTRYTIPPAGVQRFMWIYNSDLHVQVSGYTHINLLSAAGGISGIQYNVLRLIITVCINYNDHRCRYIYYTVHIHDVLKIIM